MTIFLGADHRGFDLKNQVIDWASSQGLEFKDLGAHKLLPEDDYNDYAIAVSRAVLNTPDSFGVLLCGSAQGMCMQANRFKGIRAAFCRTPDEARIAREHNNASILCLSADSLDTTAGAIIQTFIKTGFTNQERYIRRNKKLDEVTN